MDKLRQNFSWCKATYGFQCGKLNLQQLWMLVHCQQILFSHTYINKPVRNRRTNAEVGVMINLMKLSELIYSLKVIQYAL